MKARKLLACLLALALLVCALPAALAAGAEEEEITVYISACQDSAFMTAKDGTTLAYVPVKVEKGATIDDAFRALHAAYCPDGYETVESQYGPQITKFLGVESSDCGYYHNNAFAMGVGETVAQSDYLCFWFYADTTGWSDGYTFFENTDGAAVGHAKTFSLSVVDYAGTSACQGATLTVDGKKTDAVTGKDGTATLTFDKAGTYLVSAVGDPDGRVIVPPVCMVTVGAFSDTNGHQAEEAINWATERGLINGYPDGTFRPNNTITRAEFATMLFREAQARGMDVSVGENTNILGYEDAFRLPEYAIPALQWACGAGIMKGRGATLAANEPVTRQEAILMIYRFAGSPKYEAAMGMAGYLDVTQIADWAGDAMRWAVLSGIYTARTSPEGAILAPKAPATRAEIVTFLFNMK